MLQSGEIFTWRECCVCTSSSSSCDLWPLTHTQLFGLDSWTPVVSKNMDTPPHPHPLSLTQSYWVSTALSKFSWAAECLHVGRTRVHWPLKPSSASLFLLNLSVQLWPESTSYLHLFLCTTVIFKSLMYAKICRPNKEQRFGIVQ